LLLLGLVLIALLCHLCLFVLLRFASSNILLGLLGALAHLVVFSLGLHFLLRGLATLFVFTFRA
jgi:hypothetical protein